MAGELVGAGAFPGRPKGLHSLAPVRFTGLFLLTFTASGEGRKEFLGMRKDVGPRPSVGQETLWELGSSEEKAPIAPSEKSALLR